MLKPHTLISYGMGLFIYTIERVYNGWCVDWIKKV